MKVETSRRLKNARKKTAVASMVSMTCALSVNANSADSPSDGLEEVVVTGYRASLDTALDNKKKASGVVDQIIAEDIAKFPDQNLAESLQRVPGVTINQDAGEGRQITVRGLGPTYSRTRINGMEAIVTLGTTDQDGGTNRGRAFDFNVFGSEIFQSLTVHKTSSADVEEGSLGATVDLNTAKPLNFKKRTFAASAQAGYNDLSHKTSPRVAALFTDKFFDDRVGVLVSAAYGQRKAVEVGSSAVRWQASISTAGATPTASSTFFASTVPGLTTAQLGQAFRPRIPRYDYYKDDQKRLGVTASFEFKPVDSLDMSLDLLYADYKAGRDETFLEAPAFSGTAATPNGTVVGAAVDNITVTAANIDSTNTLIAGTFNNVQMRTEYRHDDMTTKFKQATYDFKYTFGPSVVLHGMFGYADSKFDNPVQTTLIWDSLTGTNGYNWNFSHPMPVINTGSLDVTNAANWKLTQVRERPQGVDNRFDSGQLDLTFALSDGVSLLAGAQYRKFGFDTFEYRRVNLTPTAVPTGNQESNIPTAIATVPTSAYSQLISIPGVHAPGATLTWMAPDLNAGATALSLYDKSIFPLSPLPILGNNYRVSEKDTSGFVQLNFKVPVGSMTLRGDVGARYVKTKQSSTGYTYTPGVTNQQNNVTSAVVASTVVNTYNNFLPSLNTALEVTDDFLVRLSASKIMSRPGLGFLNPGAAVSVSGTTFAVTAGNPYVKPNSGTAVDLSFEWYPVKGMLFGTTLFYKKLDVYIQTLRSSGAFNQNPLGLPDSVAVAACGSNTTTCSPQSTNWQFSLPANTDGGPIKGIEVNAQVPFVFLPGFWENFGVLLNYTYIDSQLDYVNGSGVVVAKGPLLESSKNSANGTLFFDNHTFSARISASYRSDYYQTIPGRNGIANAAGAAVLYGNDYEGTKGSTTYDFSTSWTFNDHLTVMLEGQNITNVPNRQFLDTQARRLGFYHIFGRQFSLGMRAKF